MFEQLAGLLLSVIGLQVDFHPDVLSETTEIRQETNTLNESAETTKPPRPLQRKTQAQIDAEKARLKNENARRLEAEKARHGGDTTTVKLGSDEASGSTGRDRQAQMKARINAHRDELQAKRRELLSDIQVKREEAKSRHETNREAFEEKLAEFRDEQKKTAVERIDIKMKSINTARTTRMVDHVSKISDVLGKALDRAQENGGDITEVETAYAAAKIALERASQAIAAQAGKEYVITLSTETKIGQDVRTATQALEADLKAVHEKVLAAQKSAREVVRAYNDMKLSDTVTE